MINLGAKPYMLAGTFNFVMAQRLSRKVCTNCRAEVEVKDDKLYQRAREELGRIPKETLVSEMQKRGINDSMWQRFVAGKVLLGSGKDAKTGETCAICTGSGYK